MAAPYKVVVGSQKPSKIEAVRQAFTKIFPESHWDIAGCPVNTDASDRPFNDLDIYMGAYKRAQAALKQQAAEFGVGLQNGLAPADGGWVLYGRVVILHQDGRKSNATTARVAVPECFYQQICIGKTLEEVCGCEFDNPNPGFHALMTNNIVTETSANMVAVALGLAKFLHPELYAREDRVAGE